MADHKPIDEETGVVTTGHEWDGIRELDNPLPRWWLYIFYATCAWAVVYWVFMPAWPGLPGTSFYTKGVRGHSDRANVAAEIAELEAARSAPFARLETAGLSTITEDPELLTFTLAAGASLFGDNCATCHGEGGAGAKGFPNLNDDIWLWGGEFPEIRQTIAYGVRNDHVETRFSQMPAYGRDGIFTETEISDLVEYVVHISGREADAEAVARASVNFEQQCSACHGAEGKGDQFIGAPNLTDQYWLYGGERSDLYTTVYNARYGVMPAFSERLEPAEITALAAYVHTLGGGQ
ncbi:MAG: cytochrome-c oxidase, cbb3-type subunit III [Maricaulaceae bacterium]